jgi:hypothetical protein
LEFVVLRVRGSDSLASFYGAIAAGLQRKIFVNYRRDDEQGFVLALCARLESAFSAQRVFMDVEDVSR